jgi:hypothetical protein
MVSDWIKKKSLATYKKVCSSVADIDQFSVEKTVYTTQTFVMEKWISPDKIYF